MQVVVFYIKNAESHVSYVLGIINHLQFKVVDEISEKFQSEREILIDDRS